MSRRLVVLLDEADVFLEKRALHQLERNALVSGKIRHFTNKNPTNICAVFLRVLEYYEGMCRSTFILLHGF